MSEASKTTDLSPKRRRQQCGPFGNASHGQLLLLNEEEEGFTLDELVEIKILWNRAHDNPENDYYNLYLNEFSDDDVKVA